MGFVEFGKAFDVTPTMTTTPDFEQMVMMEVLRDYQKAKQVNFPYWVGFPEIKTHTEINGALKVSWYVAIPNEQLFEPDDEELWQL